jgi:ParB-like chromosome segregation protein Spo0J
MSEQREEAMSYQLFPSLDPATEVALRSSIQRWGVLVPVAKDQHGNILDGHHRSRIADELGVTYRVDTHIVADPDEATEIARTLNTDRRHLDPAQRREMAAELRSDGHSTTTIARALGVSDETVRRDLAASTYVEPDTVVGADGKRYPSARPARVQQAAELLAQAEPARLDDDLIAEAEAIAETATEIEDGVAEAVKSRRVPIAVPKRQVADDIPPHPATYPRAVMDLFAELIPPHSKVFDPFAGVGTIHQLDGTNGIVTLGMEIEEEWAKAHPRTVHGDSRRVATDPRVGWKSFDVIATSPAYGNRLADNYNARDPQARRSYSIDLGRSVSECSGAGMHFDRDGSYELLHREVWAAVTQLLRPGGLFLLNCKDFRRAGKVMPVTGWHIGQLASLGLTTIDLRCIPVAGLSHATAEPLSELVVVLRKG